MQKAVIVEALRTPMGKGRVGGGLSELHSVDLLAQVLRGLVERSGIDPAAVEDVIVGCVTQASEQSATPGRMAWLSAGYPSHVPGVTIDRKCGSSQQAVQFAAHGVMVGHYDIVIAAGVESMSRVPMGSARMGGDPFGPTVTERYAPGLVSQGVASELVAHKWSLSRADLDNVALRSHQLAAEAADAGHFDREILPVRLPDGSTFSADETIRRGTTPEGLAALKPAFRTPEIEERFPELTFGMTAGNSSQISDGAAALLIMSERKAQDLGLQPRARLHAFSQLGDDPLMMLTAPIPATRMALEKAGMNVNDIDLFEVNEAFASVPLAWQADLNVPDDKLNVRGGAIALGHPLGASGARLMTTLLHTLEDRDLTWGLQTMCEAGGMANATVIERI